MSRDEDEDLESMLTVEELDASLAEIWDQVVERVEGLAEEGLDPHEVAQTELDLEHDPQTGLPILSIGGEAIDMCWRSHLALTIQYMEHCCNEPWHEPEPNHHYNGFHYQIGEA